MNHDQSKDYRTKGQNYNRFLLTKSMGCKLVLIFLFLFAIVCSLGNPGILIAVPFPLTPPTLDLHLPLTISDTVINNLELTNIQLRQVDYKWKFTTSQAEVNISQAQISFDWQFKTDHGKGFFTEDGLRLQFLWNFTATKENRFQITIPVSKLHPGSMKVSLGGEVKQTVLVEVTNLILNHASIVFRGIIANKLAQTITDTSSILGKDIQIYYDTITKKQININTTLTANPITTTNSLILQINGAPYIVGKASGYLNPTETLVKTNSNKIQVQIHKLFLNKLIELVLEVKGEVDLQLHSLDITSVIDIDSFALSPVFPPMAAFSESRDVVFKIKIQNIIFDFDGNSLIFKGKGQISVSTQSRKDKTRILYMNSVNATANFEITPIYGAFQTSLRVNDIDIITFSPDQQDVASGRIIPAALSKYFPTLMEWLTDGINFALNGKVKKFSYNRIQAVLHGHVMNEIIYFIEADLIETQ